MVVPLSLQVFRERLNVAVSAKVWLTRWYWIIGWTLSQDERELQASPALVSDFWQLLKFEKSFWHASSRDGKPGLFTK